jgi:autotransporter-associated beta strand protein
MNTFRASLFLNGGLLRFSTLETNEPGSLGFGTNITFNGGGLQWADDNSADISVRTIPINSGGATLDVGTNSVTLTRRIGNNGLGALIKRGAGTLTFNATNNYRGNTTIAEGVLALGLRGLLTNSPQLILSNNAVLDVSARIDGTHTLLAGKSLFGNGTVRGSVIAASGSRIAPGFSIGTIVVTNVLTLQSGSTNVMELNAASQTNDVLTGMVTVNYGGRLELTNVAGTFQSGQSFKLFGAGTYNGSFSSINWPALPGNLIWTNKLAIDGTIAVFLPVNTTPTNISITLIGDSLQLSWPADHTGWRLQTKSNLLDAGWSEVAGGAATNLVVLPATNGSGFFRLIYP